MLFLNRDTFEARSVPVPSRSVLMAVLLLASSGLHAQPLTLLEPAPAARGAAPSGEQRLVEASRDRLLQLGREAEQRVWLPLDGESVAFTVRDAKVLPEELAQRFPEIRAFVGESLEPPTRRVRLETGPRGLRIQLHDAEGRRSWLEPSTPAAVRPVARPANAPRPACGADGSWETPHWQRPVARFESTTIRSDAAVSVRRRDYRLAMAATGEYTRFHGGTVASGLAAVVTVVNRLNEVFETELAMHFELVPNNDLLIYTNPNTDPYTGNSPSALISENQDNLDTEIGNGAYDVGHVLSNAGGGLAFIGAVCDPDFKAGGMTGTSTPEGDLFIVDFVAHELGHQLGARHTFNGTTNACGGQRDPRAAWEPGSGTTIMSYAGLCGAENVQEQVDPFFHVGSIEEMLTYAESFGTCSATRNISNQKPEVSVPSEVVIPASTPFRLTGSATDNPSQSLSYSWEQFDLGTRSPPDVDDGRRPLFRSFPPEADGTRTFPQMDSVFLGTSELGETLPTRSRDMNFRLTVRDNARFSGLQWEDYSFRVDRRAGPFRVLRPASGDLWNGSSAQVIWDVASTDVAPVACTSVDVRYYPNRTAAPQTLVAGTPNDGNAVVAVPGSASSQARVEVSCSNGTFFAVNPGPFTVDRPLDCGASQEDLCLDSERFVVQATFRTRQGTTGSGRILPLTDDTGAFWFFDPANLEVVVKVLDGCAINGRHWVFAAGLTDVEVTLTVTDRTTGESKTYVNPLGTPFAPIQDVQALGGC